VSSEGLKAIKGTKGEWCPFREKRGVKLANFFFLLKFKNLNIFVNSKKDNNLLSGSLRLQINCQLKKSTNKVI
jgi:hypothetical protein